MPTRRKEGKVNMINKCKNKLVKKPISEKVNEGMSE